MRPRLTMGSSIAIGVGIGAAIGIATNDIALWTAVGVPLGVAIGAAAQSFGVTDADGGEPRRDPE